MRSHSLPSRAAGALAATVLLAGALAVPAFGWLTAGHSRVAMAAVEALPRSMPSFFRNGGWSIGQAAVDPDLMKDKQLPALGALVWPDHFLDSELLQGAPLPADRSAFIDFLQSKHLTLSKVGTLPYAILARAVAHDDLRRVPAVAARPCRAAARARLRRLAG